MDAEQVRSKADFLQFMAALQQDLADNSPQWENRKLADYLEALGRWVEDMEGYYRNTGQEVPRQISWRVFASILRAASIYE
ncbi:DUF7660 family protein [Hymenobacter jeollabukensis]|uniref:DUF7660 domain-containing protein n=1 Tax=Hymenobacter jeollabukensis TaxID=2025313 RepID=A0A5R8WQY0_9BACT|nr:hypothetical protein [Hymenobacter jeollabukensis]TLM92422.1 hypothetical protein FDY95_13415 [Hymenobacter jeollabukensis]